MRCAACGARNPASASWCTQCYTPFAASEAAATTGPAAAAGPAADEAAAAERPAGAARSVPSTGPGARDVREQAGSVEWRCRRCDRWSPLLATSCVTCGNPRQGFGEEAAPPDRELAPGPLLGASAVLPGAGHVLAGRVGTGVARLLLWSLWLLSGLAAIRGADGAAASVPGVVLLAGAGVLWGATLVDAQRLAAGDDRELLGPRPLRWLVGGVIVALVLAVLVATVIAR
jgi:hypothetical protein